TGGVQNTPHRGDGCSPACAYIWQPPRHPAISPSKRRESFKILENDGDPLKSARRETRMNNVRIREFNSFGSNIDRPRTRVRWSASYRVCPSKLGDGTLFNISNRHASNHCGAFVAQDVGPVPRGRS